MTADDPHVRIVGGHCQRLSAKALALRGPPLQFGRKSRCSHLVGGFWMAVYVVTGGGGFIGSHIVEELVRRKETVKVIDNFSTAKRENVEPFKNRAEFIDADIAEAQDLARFLK